MRNSTIKKSILSIITIIVLVIVWILVVNIKNNSMIYPSISQIFNAFKKIFSINGLESMGNTLFRVLKVLIISGIISIFISCLYVIWPSSYSLFIPIIRIMKTVPFICVSIFIIIIFNKETAPFIIGLILILPLMCEGFKAGIDQIDKNIKDDLALLDINLFVKIKKVYIPLILPNIIVTLLQTFGLGFKVVIMGECFAQTKKSVGSILYVAQSFIQMDEIIAWTIFIVLIVFIIEILINVINNKRNKLIY